MNAGAHVLRGGLLATVVDRGRFGHRAEGVPCGGALDAVGFAAANLLAGNAGGAAAIEVTLGDFVLRFENDVRFGLGGADCGADLDGVRVDAWGSYPACAGATLTMRRPRRGARSYLAIAGGIAVPSVLDSRTTLLAASFGGYEGRALREGDRLPLGAETARTFARDRRLRCKPPQWDFAREAFARAHMPLRMLPGAEYQLLAPSARTQFWASTFTLGPQSDRMGARLNGDRPVSLDCSERRSHAVFPGVVQLPPSGEPIVLMADAQTTGGYPKLGAVVDADLWKLAQLAAGAPVRFVACTLEAAGEARREVAQYLHGVEASLE